MVLEKYEVHNPMPLIVGSSVGGLLLLALITAILYKVSVFILLSTPSAFNSTLYSISKSSSRNQAHILAKLRHVRDSFPPVPHVCTLSDSQASLSFTLLCLSTCFH